MRQPGEWIHGKYQVERVLGSGGMGVVYATRRRNESRAAVKVLHPRFARDKTVRARFVEEGYLANRVGHPAVVTILEDDIDENGNFYLVMEQLDGVDLGKFVDPGCTPVTIAQALNIADQLLAALVQAHQKGIVHRDIKPANVMILRDGRLKLLDFGIAQALGGDSGVSTDEDDDDDDEEEILGTDRYMSPEQGQGFLDAIDARTDLWSVGALLMALLAEEEPSAVPLWDQSYEERAWSFSRLGEKVPPHVVQIISLALQPQKSRRWASAATMKGAVEAAHLDLFGPISRDALASLAVAKLGASPMGTDGDDGQETEPPVPIDPTAVSRRSPLPPRARSSSVPERPDDFRTSEAAALPLATARNFGFATLALVVLLLVVSSLWFFRSTPNPDDVPPALGTAEAIQDFDVPSNRRGEDEIEHEGSPEQVDSIADQVDLKPIGGREPGSATQDELAPEPGRTPKSSPKTSGAPLAEPPASAQPGPQGAPSKQPSSGALSETEKGEQSVESSPTKAPSKTSPGGLNDIFRVQKNH
jgi:serine/threonine protein kinase